MSTVKEIAGRKLTRRGALKAGGATALGALILGRTGPFIGNAQAATPTLRLLMWQPYAIKETIAAFEDKFKAKFAPTFFDGNSEAFNKLKVGGTKDFDMVMADGFWPRLYFRQGLTKALDYGKIASISARVTEIGSIWKTVSTWLIPMMIRNETIYALPQPNSRSIS